MNIILCLYQLVYIQFLLYEMPTFNLNVIK